MFVDVFLSLLCVFVTSSPIAVRMYVCTYVCKLLQSRVLCSQRKVQVN